jgi:heme/copper-type cytochrome/quinol oxidase subunit 3
MSHEPRFSGDLRELPTDAFGHRSLTWWGVLAFMVIEGAAFAMAVAAYFMLMNQEGSWPPRPHAPPDLVAGTVFTLLMLLSEIPNGVIKKAAAAKQRGTVQVGLLLMALIGVALFAVRALEFQSLNIGWTENAYGSVIWMLLVLHTVHVLTDWIDTLVLAALMFTPQSKSPRRYVDVAENSLYWRFVWLTWLPLYALIYWVPRWVP